MAPLNPTTALQVAEALLLAGDRMGLSDFTARKLQKLLYFAQLYHFGFHGTGAFQDNLWAWKDGPVVPDVWHAFKPNRPPDEPITSKDIRDAAKIDALLTENGCLRETVRKVLEDFGSLRQDKLVELTHGQQPWIKTWRAAKLSGNDRIEKSDLQEFAKKLVRHMRQTEYERRFNPAIERLHQTPGDVRFVLGKMALANAAGELSEALILGRKSDELLTVRGKLRETLEQFLPEFGSKVPLGIDLENPEEVDQFAVELTDYAMEHRVR